jgi:hypothetical protein
MTCKAMIKEKLTWFDCDKHFWLVKFLIRQALAKCKYIPALK